MKSSLSEHSLLQYSLVRRPHPLTSQQSWFFNENMLIISLASVELKSRLLTWHYLLKTLHGHQTLFLGREWGLGMRLYVASTGVAWSELVNNRCHFWMVRQGTAWFHYVAIICHVGNPSKLLAGPITEVLGFFFGWPLQTLSSLLWCLHTLALKHRTASAT